MGICVYTIHASGYECISRSVSVRSFRPFDHVVDSGRSRQGGNPNVARHPIMCWALTGRPVCGKVLNCTNDDQFVSVPVSLSEGGPAVTATEHTAVQKPQQYKRPFPNTVFCFCIMAGLIEMPPANTTGQAAAFGSADQFPGSLLLPISPCSLLISLQLALALGVGPFGTTAKLPCPDLARC